MTNMSRKTRRDIIEFSKFYVREPTIRTIRDTVLLTVPHSIGNLINLNLSTAVNVKMLGAPGDTIVRISTREYCSWPVKQRQNMSLIYIRQIFPDSLFKLRQLSWALVDQGLEFELPEEWNIIHPFVEKGTKNSDR